LDTWLRLAKPAKDHIGKAENELNIILDRWEDQVNPAIVEFL